MPTSGFNPINAEYAADVGIVARDTTTPESTSRENCRGGGEVRGIMIKLDSDPDDDDDEDAVKICEELRRVKDVIFVEKEDTFVGYKTSKRNASPAKAEERLSIPIRQLI